VLVLRKQNVFSAKMKLLMHVPLSLCMMWSGRKFQAVGPATANSRTLVGPKWPSETTILWIRQLIQISADLGWLVVATGWASDLRDRFLVSTQLWFRAL